MTFRTVLASQAVENYILEIKPNMYSITNFIINLKNSLIMRELKQYYVNTTKVDIKDSSISLILPTSVMMGTELCCVISL